MPDTHLFLMKMLSKQIASSHDFTLTDFISLAALGVSLFTFSMTLRKESKRNFVEIFNKIYSEAFTLRGKLSSDNQDFYYELDSILANKELEEKMLDSLTKLENMFFYTLPSWSIRKEFRNLISLALYQRLLASYNYILYRRHEVGNQKMFSNYEKAITKMKGMKKIKGQLKMNTKNYCWVGIRKSDTSNASTFLKDSISLFDDFLPDETFEKRPNQNIPNKKILPFYDRKIKEYMAENPSDKYIFYNQSTAYHYGQSVIEKTNSLNSKELLKFLNDKILFRKWLIENDICVPAFETYVGSEIEFDTLKRRFKDAESFVVQIIRGGGGIGSFHVTKDNITEIKRLLISNVPYIVSPYIPNISVNTHIFVTGKQSVISPGSIQIIEERNYQLCYRGADFIAFRDLPDKIMESVRLLSIKMANLLREKGYVGIAGLDFMIDRFGEIYCTEINPRFQASSILLDIFMNQNADFHKSKIEIAKSTIELNEMAFDGILATTLHFYDKINYSCYYYYNDGYPTKQYLLKSALLQTNDVRIDFDGFSSQYSENMIGADSYLFRAIFTHKITQISPDRELWINDNIPVSPEPADDLDLKIALLNQGIRLSPNSTPVKEGVYNSIDITVYSPHSHKSFVVNCAYKTNLSQFSPFSISQSENGSCYLLYYDKIIADIHIPLDPLQYFTEEERKILFYATDRLRIKIISGCEFKNNGTGCKFCNLPISCKQHSLPEIVSALEKFKKVDPHNFNHILIGGGTCLADNAWNLIKEISQYLKSDSYYKTKPISLMSVLPPANELSELKECGISELAFNLEIAEQDKAVSIMPGKRFYTKESYYQIMEESIRIYGIKNVRSALIVGIDKRDKLLEEVAFMAEQSIIPCLSPFRILSSSEMSNWLNPTNEYLRHIYEKCVLSLVDCNSEIKELGPRCIQCRNNNLIL